MAVSKDIPYLLALIDDDSAEIRATVGAELENFGPQLELSVLPLWDSLTTFQQSWLSSLYPRLRWNAFQSSWPDWQQLRDEREATEQAFAQLAYLAHGYSYPPLHVLLDDLQERYETLQYPSNIDGLLFFLFRELRFGAPQQAYYHPDNSNLVRVILRREGLQISLACVASLLARRLHLPLYGMNVPGHFMMVGYETDTPVVYDPFEKGARVDLEALQAEQRRHGRDPARFNRRAMPQEIVMRTLRNLIYACRQQNGYEDMAEKYLNLLEALAEYEDPYRHAGGAGDGR